MTESEPLEHSLEPLEPFEPAAQLAITGSTSGRDLRAEEKSKPENHLVRIRTLPEAVTRLQMVVSTAELRALHKKRLFSALMQSIHSHRGPI